MNVKVSSQGSLRLRVVLSCHSVYRRIQAVIVVLALLVAPLALYARGADDAMRDCNGMCCLPHAHSMAMKMAVPASASQASPAEASTAAEPECHHGAAAKATTHTETTTHPTQLAAADAAQHAASTNSSAAAMKCALECAAHHAPHSGNFGLLVPIAPTKPSSIVMIRVTVRSQRLAFASTAAASQDFAGSPFQPPRA